MKARAIQAMMEKQLYNSRDQLGPSSHVCLSLGAGVCTLAMCVHVVCMWLGITEIQSLCPQRNVVATDKQRMF